MNEAQQQTVQRFLGQLEDTASASYDKGNKFAAFYLANICGMWAQILDHKGPRFPNNNELYDWYLAGIAASREAVQQHDKLREIWKKKEVAEDEVRKKKKGFRLW